jgi:hypothetical protein
VDHALPRHPRVRLLATPFPLQTLILSRRRYGLRQFRKEQEDRKNGVAQGKAVKGGQTAVMRLRLLGLRVSNLRDEREVKKENKLDGVRLFPSLTFYFIR